MAVRFGLLGTGHWAAETQGAALAAHPEAELVGVWGRDPAKAAALAERYSARPYEDVDALLADVDAVAVALPPDVQADLAVRAAAAGRHLLLDKPLAFTTAAADRIAAEVDRNRLVCRVFFTNRYQPVVTDFLGSLGSAGGWQGGRSVLFASIFQPGNPYGGSPWRRDRGGLWDIGPHALSLLLPVLGPVRRVATMDGPQQTSHTLLEHASGAVAVMSVSLDAPPAAAAVETVFHGTAGYATVPAGTLSLVDAFGTAVTEFAAAVGTGTLEHPCDARLGRDVVAILAAADTARRESRTVPV
jgi:predicted dehydrogenase